MKKKPSPRIYIGFKVKAKFKDKLQKYAKKENRSLSSFIINAIIIYVKDHHKEKIDGY
jgi:uncharacterized protein (DUF1778 family)